MYRRFGLLYTVFSVLVLIVLVLLVLVRVNTTREFNVQEAQTSFLRLQGQLADALAARRAPDGSVFQREIRDYARQVPTLQAATVYDPDRGYRYVWASDAQIIPFARNDLSELRGFPTYNLSDVTQLKISAPITDADPELYLDGVYRVLSFADAYPPIRDSLIALVAFAFLTVLIAVALNLSSRSQVESDSASDETPRAAGYGAATPPPVPGDRARDQTLQSGDVPPASAHPDRTERSLTTAEPILEEVDLEEIATDAGEPGTLFNPVSGLSYRQHLEKRLGLELERAAFNDQDLTCMLVRFPDAETGGEAHAARARQILAAFKFEDLCFEYEKGSFCIILPNTELSRGIREAEAYKGDHKGTMYFGLSARNGRLVEASRVLGEAERSLEHAQHEPGGIVGFQPDPRRYRQFVTQHSEHSVR